MKKFVKIYLLLILLKHWAQSEYLKHTLLKNKFASAMEYTDIAAFTFAT